ncbi:hypothetical protein [Halomonas sp. H5]|uniref:hypothetical protein n=1 Tax=Halomonas sp. H5 TaxID=3423910 RepID=UPI003D36D687
MNSVTKIQTEQTAPAIMAEIKDSLDSLAGVLVPISQDPQTDSSVEAFYPGPDAPLAEEHAAMAVSYIAKEIALASRFAGLLLEVDPSRANQPIDTRGLTVFEQRRLSCVGPYETGSDAVDAGEALFSHLGAVGQMTRWLIERLECVDALMTPVPALYLVIHRLDATEAHVESWVEVMMGRHAKASA